MKENFPTAGPENDYKEPLYPQATMAEVCIYMIWHYMEPLETLLINREPPTDWGVENEDATTLQLQFCGNNSITRSCHGVDREAPIERKKSPDEIEGPKEDTNITITQMSGGVIDDTPQELKDERYRKKRDEELNGPYRKKIKAEKKRKDEQYNWEKEMLGMHKGKKMKKPQEEKPNPEIEDL